jgi:DNA-binding response OmpR family regulator
MKILLVEDDPRVGMALRSCIETWKHEVEIVLNGEEAWQAVQNRDIGLLITDWALPGLTGNGNSGSCFIV